MWGYLPIDAPPPRFVRVTLLALGSKHLVSWVDMACGGDTINMNIIWMDDRKAVVKDDDDG